MISALQAVAGVYAVVTLILLGVFVGDEMRFKHPQYRQAIAFAVGWPLVVGFALVKRAADGGSDD